jgi:hypothetical protein
LRQANSVYDLPSTEQAIKWMHAVCGYPVKSTWIKAIKAGNYIGWPMLTERNVNKYYPETSETPKGRMNQTRKNVRSTKAKQTPLETCDTLQLHSKKVRDIYTTMYDIRETMFLDQTGQFLMSSQSGNKYIMVLVKIDSNAILVEPMKSRKDTEMIQAYNALLLRLKRAGIIPKKHLLDNEFLENMKNHIHDTCKINMELVPPGCHQRNAVEVAIRNFKSHFLKVLAGVADDFLQNLWDHLLPQTEITLNLIRQSNAMPTVSAYAHLSGPFNYNNMPLAPMGCEAQIHEKTNKQGTWAYHSIDGWYLFTSPEHYRTHTCHVKATKSERHLDTVHFKHKNITNPTITHADKVMQALAECVKTITGATGGKTAQEVNNLQRVVKATQAILDKSKAPSNNSNAEQRATRVPNILRVHALLRVPPATADNQQITRAMSKVINKVISTLTTMPTSAPTPDTTSKPTSVPTTSAKRDRLRKRRIAQLHNDANTTGNSPQIRT